jgi:hypothetical protein
MCGIFGYVTNKEEALGPILIAAAERLTYTCEGKKLTLFTLEKCQISSFASISRI